MRPYDMVYVQRDGFRHIGEVMSFPTPSETIMVRAVPGYPNTLIEVPTSACVPVMGDYKKNLTRYVHFAAVNGRGSFPVDMLRYDFAAPVNFTLDEDERTGRVKANIIPAFGFDDLIIGAVTSTRREPWTRARWSSFLWGIRHMKTEDRHAA